MLLGNPMADSDAKPAEPVRQAELARQCAKGRGVSAIIDIHWANGRLLALGSGIVLPTLRFARVPSRRF